MKHAGQLTFDSVVFPGGAASFADQLISYDNTLGGNPPTETDFVDPAGILGMPDYSSSIADSAVTLGGGGQIVVQFTDNALFGDGTSAEDLWIFEVGPNVEGTAVEISQDGQTWVSVGSVGGSTSGIDIDAVLPSSNGVTELYYYVRLTDDNLDNGSGYFGADIDAVGAISTRDGTDFDAVVDAGQTNTGTDGKDYVDTSTGDDSLDAGDGDDSVEASAGADTLRGGAGNDTINGGDGNDALRGDEGSDSLSGGQGDDRIFAGADDDDGDYLDGGDGNDVLGGGAGGDTIMAGNGSDTAYGGEGADLISDGGSDTEGNTFWAGAGFDIVAGGEGDDLLGGGDGGDAIAGRGGDDTIYGGSDQSNDTISGNEGNDVIFGGAGNDSLDGNEGNDLIYNGGGADTVDAGDGRDTLWGGGGDDQLTGGTGADVFAFAFNNGNDIIVDFEIGADVLDLTELGLTSEAAVTDNMLNAAGGVVLNVEGIQIQFLGLSQEEFEAADGWLAF